MTTSTQPPFTRALIALTLSCPEWATHFQLLRPLLCCHSPPPRKTWCVLEACRPTSSDRACTHVGMAAASGVSVRVVRLQNCPPCRATCHDGRNLEFKPPTACVPRDSRLAWLLPLALFVPSARTCSHGQGCERTRSQNSLASCWTGPGAFWMGPRNFFFFFIKLELIQRESRYQVFNFGVRGEGTPRPPAC
jgi:hypothetical protein